MSKLQTCIRFVILMYVTLCAFQTSMSGQFELAFEEYSNSQSRNLKTAKITSGSRYTLPNNVLVNLPNQDLIEFSISEEFQFLLELKQTELISSNHLIHISSPNAQEALRVELNEPLYILSGKLKSHSDSYVSFTVKSDGIEGFIDTGKERYYLEKLQDQSTKDISEYVFYESQDITDKTIHCLVNEEQGIHHSSSHRKSNSNGCLNINLAIAVDYAYFQLYNHNITDVIARTITVANASAHDYATAFSDSISFNISEHYITTCENCEPWQTNEDALFLLEEFSHWAEDGGFHNDFHLGQLWIGGDLKQDQNSNTIGYAFKGGLCSDKKYHVLEDFSETLSKLRFLASHEIGHNLNCNHDAPGTNTIMSSTVSTSNSWSTKSILDVNSFVTGMSCIEACSNSACQQLEDFSIDDFTASKLDISWATGDSTRIVIMDESTGQQVFNKTTNERQLSIIKDFSDCTAYRLLLHSICNGIESPTIGIALATPKALYTEILDVRVYDCNPGQVSDYKLEFVIDHNGKIADSFYLDINGNTTGFIYSSSPQLISLNKAQINTDAQEFEIQVFAILDSKLYCLDLITFDNKPNATCDLVIYESFDDCQLPFNWDISSSNQSFFSFPFSWQFDDDFRKILNYGKSDNATKDKTINGSCMAYFDDDINNRPEYTGNVVLQTDQYDLTAYSNVHLSFSYIFHDFSDIKAENNSYFSLQVWNGTIWTTLLYEDEILCPWSDVWNSHCAKDFTINLDQYSHARTQFRFIYSDGDSGDWAGMVALDDFTLSGERIIQYGCTDSEALNFDHAAQVDNGSCYSCQNGIMDGQETGIDCGGPDCGKCIIPCAQKEITITEIHADISVSDVDLAIISAVNEHHHIVINPGVAAKLDPGFEIKKGASIEAFVSLCHE